MDFRTALKHSETQTILSKIRTWLTDSISNGDNHYHIYPTPPLGQDMTQGQFLSRV